MEEAMDILRIHHAHHMPEELEVIGLRLLLQDTRGIRQRRFMHVVVREGGFVHAAPVAEHGVPHQERLDGIFGFRHASRWAVRSPSNLAFGVNAVKRCSPVGCLLRARASRRRE